MKIVKPKTCRYCKSKFTPKYALQVVCGPNCAIGWVTLKREQKERKELRLAKQKIKTKSEHLKECQIIFNKFIRMRDVNKPCVSCGRPISGKPNAGHFRSVGSSPHLRFNEHNCVVQCIKCNQHLSGNLINYRRGLIERIGIEKVEQLEADQAQKHYTIEDIKSIKELYKEKIKQLTLDHERKLIC
jgi:hypothetical protein